MKKILDKHYCKYCQTHFNITIEELETGDTLLVCPKCEWPHYRYFKNGKSVHCDINKRAGIDMKEIKGKHHLTLNKVTSCE